MRWNEHSRLESTHCPFSPSKYSWLNYSDEKMVEVFNNLKNVERGTKLHDWAKQTILLKLRQPNKKNNIIYKYVNDAIDYRMDPEILLYFSKYFYGTTDAICFNKNTLRIHDLKTGETPAKMEQLRIYAALFCLEYRIDPNSINIELRIYQNNNEQIENPDGSEIKYIMDKIVHLNDILEKIDSGDSNNE